MDAIRRANIRRNSAILSQLGINPNEKEYRRHKTSRKLQSEDDDSDFDSDEPVVQRVKSARTKFAPQRLGMTHDDHSDEDPAEVRKSGRSNVGSKPDKYIPDYGKNKKKKTKGCPLEIVIPVQRKSFTVLPPLISCNITPGDPIRLQVTVGKPKNISNIEKIDIGSCAALDLELDKICKPLNLPISTMASNARRGKGYMCSKCGVLKKGHVCTGSIFM